MKKTTMFPEALPAGEGTPLFADEDNAFEKWVERKIGMEEIAATFDEMLMKMGITSKERGIGKIDEVAIMVHDEHQEYHLIEGAVRNGYTVFNAADDYVHTGPIESEYSVHYTFLQHPEQAFRIEVMRLEEGVSPVHSTLLARALLAGHTGPVVVHASFKVPDLATFGEVEQRLTDTDFLLAQACSSTYGSFAYYRPSVYAAGLEQAAVYLKPRVNTRDQA